MTATEVYEFIAQHDRGTAELNGEVETIETIRRASADGIIGGVPFTIHVPEKYRSGLKESYTFRVDFTRLFPRGLWVKCITTDGTEVYVGRLNDWTGQVELTGASQWKATTPALRLLNRVLARVWTGDYAAFEQFGFTATIAEGK